MTVVFRATDLKTADSDESLLAPPMATPLSGDIVVRGHSFLDDDERGIYSGSWESEPGDTAYFPLGWKGVWTVHERLRKVYVVYVPKSA